MRRQLFAVLCLVAAGQALAQNSLTFDVDMSAGGQATVSWFTVPDAGACVASGDWSGNKASNGSETLPPITSTVTYTLECTWAADSIATLSWVNPTQNTDGSPYEDPLGIRLAWTNGGDIASFDCLDPGASPSIDFTDRPPDQAMHTVTGLGPTGTWEFAAYAVNQNGLCSASSNVAAKTFGGAATMTDSIRISVPAPITGLGAT